MADLRHPAPANSSSTRSKYSAFGAAWRAPRLANPVTLCDGHGIFFVAASGQIQIQMAADSAGLADYRVELRFGLL
jgi:hypothetical protein